MYIKPMLVHPEKFLWRKKIKEIKQQAKKKKQRKQSHKKTEDAAGHEREVSERERESTSLASVTRPMMPQG